MSDTNDPFGADAIVIPFAMEQKPGGPRADGGMARMRPAGWLYRYGIAEEPEQET